MRKIIKLIIFCTLTSNFVVAQQDPKIEISHGVDYHVTIQGLTARGEIFCGSSIIVIQIG